MRLILISFFVSVLGRASGYTVTPPAVISDSNKVGVFKTTEPVAQAPAVVLPPTGDIQDDEVRASLNQIIQTLKNYGLMAPQ